MIQIWTLKCFFVRCNTKSVAINLMSYNEIYNKKNYFSFASQGEVTYEKLSNIYELRY